MGTALATYFLGQGLSVKKTAVLLGMGLMAMGSTFHAGAQDIAIGAIHACAIDADSSTHCWGSNRLGLLGANSAASDSHSPLKALTPVPLSGVDAGYFHQCGMGVDAHVYCWGDNEGGQLGLGNSVSQPLPALVPGLDSVASVLLGGNHSCAIKTNGTLWCWGLNTTRQLGTDQPDFQLSPTLVPALPGGAVTSASAGFGHTCALTEDKTVRCWGANWNGQLGNVIALGQSTAQALPVGGINQPVSALSAGFAHTCAIAGAGQVYCWGSNDTGQLATGDTFDRTTAFAVPGLTAATAIAAGGDHTCAIVAGTVRCWGSSRYGQLGHGGFSDQWHPVQVNMPGIAIAIQAGYEGTCARNDTGAVYCWGNNEFGEVGNDTYGHEKSGVRVSGWDGALAIAGGENHQCAVVLQGSRSVRCAGDDSQGQLGNGSMQQRVKPVAVAGLDQEIGDSIAVGAAHSCVIANGNAWCWGDNSEGQLGQGNLVALSEPQPLPGAITDLIQVVAGAQHTCALDSTGKVWCWGSNTFGAVGAPDNESVATTRRLVALDAPATSLTAGSNHTCAVLTDSTVTCWGNNDSGQIGIGNNDGIVFTPTQVLQLSGVTDIAAGQSHTCARKDNGNIVCWGRNDIGQLGLPDPVENPFIPNLIPGLPPMQTIASGGIFNCALTQDGKRWCWGDDFGNGFAAEPMAPHLVETPYTINAISAGASHVCDMSGQGSSTQVYCSGDNGRGQFGNGQSGAWATPQRVGGGAIFSDSFEN